MTAPAREAAQPEASADEDTGAGQRLTPRLTVEQVVQVYERAEAAIVGACEQIAAAEQALNDTFTLSGPGIAFRDRWSRVRFNAPEDAITELRRSVWDSLVERLELRRFMSIRAFEELEKQLRDGEPPPIDSETVGAMVRQYHEAIPAMLEEKVAEVHDLLRPHRDTYKTNQPFEIGERVVLEGVLDTWSMKHLSKRTASVHHYWWPRLSALESVFQALDGQGSVTKQHYSELQLAIQQTEIGKKGSTRYFEFRAFGKGTLHVRFLRQDLLKRLNEIAGGKRLRGERKAS